MQDNASFFIAIAISIAILMGFHMFYEVPRQKALQAQVQASQLLKGQPSEEKPAAARERAGLIAESQRVKVDNDKIRGSINLAGSRIDDLTLERYRATTDPKSPEIILLSPAGSEVPKAYYAEFGWLSTDEKLRLPVSDSVWSSTGGAVTPDHPVTLRWDNGMGLSFEREISIDQDYMFTIKEKVKNSGNAAVSLFPFGLISRHGTPHTLGYSTLHEGPLGVLSGRLVEKNYKKLKSDPLVTDTTTGGWLGVTDAYWLAAIIPPQDEKLGARFLHSMVGAEDRYQVDLQGEGRALAPGAATEHVFHFFAGAKEVPLLDRYGKDLNIPMFDKAVDFGWFYFLAKPFFFLIEFLAKTLGNYGLAIIAFTIVLRACFFPLSESSYRSMARMKELQPQMNSLKERFANDPQKMNEELMKLYGKEKLNPMSGCLPVFIQIPVFFALYKVLLVSIEMRHAPFYGWIHDLSAPDPTNIFNLFGLLSFTPPLWIPHIGAWPILMGITMFVQMKLSPQQPDKTMQMVFMLMPFMFVFMLANVSAGLVIYWTLSNLLALAQQNLISHRAKKKSA